ncbi:MAG: hypothetical protein ACRENQ_15455 [Gemmatimonadaceae bacterium]
MPMHTWATTTRVRRTGLQLALWGALCMGGLAVSACNATDQLLSARDPDLINPSDLGSPDGAEALRVGALARFSNMTAGSDGNESTWMFGGLLADEWATSSTFVQDDEVDERNIKLDNSIVTGQYRAINRVRTAANQAIVALQTYSPTQSVNIAEMYLARGYAELQLASDFCNGIPLSDAAGDNLTYGTPLTVAEVFTRAVASFDSGLALGGSDPLANALKIAKARAQVGLGDPAGAATTVAGVLTTYSYNHTYAISSGSNQIWSQAQSSRRYNVGDSIEGNSHNIPVANNLPFFSAGDPRLPASYTINTVGGKPDTVKSQDGQTFSRTTSLYGQETPIAVANGIDARLIEAEAALKAGDAPGMFTILDALRGAPQTIGTITTPVMPALTDPGTADGRIDLLFREKAFWTFSRGQRLGDLRRLVRQYNRPVTSVFPEGQHYRGGDYGPDVNLPVPNDEMNNPNFTGCIDRNA